MKYLDSRDIFWKGRPHYRKVDIWGAMILITIVTVQMQRDHVLDSALGLALLVGSLGITFSLASLERSTEQADLAIAALLEARKQTYLIRNGPDAPLPPDYELLHLTLRPARDRPAKTHRLIVPPWWTPEK